MAREKMPTFATEREARQYAALNHLLVQGTVAVNGKLRLNVVRPNGIPAIIKVQEVRA